MSSCEPPADPTGRTAEPVRVVRVPDAHAALAERLLSLLSDAERARAAGIRAGGARVDFVVARAILRVEIGRVLGCDPVEVPIRATATGKPVVDGGDGGGGGDAGAGGGGGGGGDAGGFGAGGEGPQVAVTHTGGLVLVAWHPALAVGIDVERADRAVDPALVDRVATDAERAALAGLPDSSRLSGLLRLWVRKEAVAKADGRGLALVLADLEVLDERALAVDAPMHEPLRVALTAGGALGGGAKIAGVSSAWVRDLDVGAGHVAAVATIGGAVEVSMRSCAGLGR